MPAHEICRLLLAEDPKIVRRTIELHLERLEERVAEQRRALAHAERELTRATVERARAS
jgi:hypothetical protein